MITMQRLLSIYYQCCYQGHWKELTDLLQFKLSKPPSQNLLYRCVKGGHQYCIANSAIQNAVDALQKSGILSKKYADFETLYEDVSKLLSPISGIGDLTIYDTALRIGFIQYPAIFPREYVYLARGAKTGAENLLGIKVAYREPISLFAQYFGNMSSHFVEDFLCVLKDFLVINGVKKGNIPPHPSICGCACSQSLAGKISQCGCSKSMPSKTCGCCVRHDRQMEDIDKENSDNGEKYNH